MYCIVTHNAVGTVYQFVGSFPTVENAEAFYDRWHHTGLARTNNINDGDGWGRKGRIEDC